MNKFEEFEKDFENVEILKGMKCAKVTLTFVSEDGDQAEIGLTREGFEDFDKDEKDQQGEEE